MYEVNFKYRFEAAHRFVGSCSTQCSTPHGHTWYASLCLQSVTDELDQNQMLVEFGELKKPWMHFITKVADHSFMINEKDPLISALVDHIPNVRLIRFPGDPTTELVAQLFYLKAKALYKPFEALIRPKSVYIEETPTNHLKWEGPVKNPSLLDPKQWWNEA